MSVLALILSYLAGSIPSAVWAGRMFHGIDIREHGSGNAGATNTVRVLGWKTGVPVLVFDLAKGWLAASLPVFLNAAPEGSQQMTVLKIVMRSGSNHRSCLPGLCRLPRRQGRGDNLRRAPCPPPAADPVMCRHIPGSAADKQLCITQFNDCRSNVPGAAHDRFPDTFAVC